MRKRPDASIEFSPISLFWPVIALFLLVVLYAGWMRGIWEDELDTHFSRDERKRAML